MFLKKINDGRHISKFFSFILRLTNDKCVNLNEHIHTLFLFGSVTILTDTICYIDQARKNFKPAEICHDLNNKLSNSQNTESNFKVIFSSWIFWN